MSPIRIDLERSSRTRRIAVYGLGVLVALGVLGAWGVQRLGRTGWEARILRLDADLDRTNIQAIQAELMAFAADESGDKARASYFRSEHIRLTQHAGDIARHIAEERSKSIARQVIDEIRQRWDEADLDPEVR